MEESSPLRLRLGDDLLSSLRRDWVGVTRPRRLLRRLGVDAGDDMVLWLLRDKRNLALSCPAPGPLVPRIRVSCKRAQNGESGFCATQENVHLLFYGRA